MKLHRTGLPYVLHHFYRPQPFVRRFQWLQTSLWYIRSPSESSVRRDFTKWGYSGVCRKLPRHHYPHVRIFHELASVVLYRPRPSRQSLVKPHRRRVRFSQLFYILSVSCPPSINFRYGLVARICRSHRRVSSLSQRSAGKARVRFPVSETILLFFFASF